jgi:hypothetical protein
MNIEYDPSQSSVYIHTLSSDIHIPKDFRVIFVNDEIHFIKPGVDIANYAEHAILKWGSNSEDSVSTSNVFYINADNVETNLETYLKNIDTKLSAIPTLPILAGDVLIRNTPEVVTLPTELGSLLGRIMDNRHNLERVRVALLLLGIVPTDWQS